MKVRNLFLCPSLMIVIFLTMSLGACPPGDATPPPTSTDSPATEPSTQVSEEPSTNSPTNSLTDEGAGTPEPETPNSLGESSNLPGDGQSLPPATIDPNSTPPEPVEIPGPATPDPPAEPNNVTAEIVEPLPPAPAQLWQYCLTSDEIGYVWSRIPCATGEVTDPYVADPRYLMTTSTTFDTYREYHSIIFRPDLGILPSPFLYQADLELYCLYTNPDWMALMDGFIMSHPLTEELSLETPDPNTWRPYCLPAITTNWRRVSWGQIEKGRWYQVGLINEFIRCLANPTLYHGLALQHPMSEVCSEWSIFASPTYNFAMYHPYLKVSYYPRLDLKLPLLHDIAWELTTEAGGGDCAWPTIDEYHTGNGFYSLDFSSGVVYDGKITRWVTPEVVAAAHGVVTKVVHDDPTAGNYVIVGHGGGIDTRYLHLADGSVCVQVGDIVYPSDRLGTMGNTGASSGIHLHFAVRHNGSGCQDDPVISEQVRLEGRPLTDFKIHCEGGQRKTFYRSSNTR